MFIADCSWSAGFGAKWHGDSKVNTSHVTSDYVVLPVFAFTDARPPVSLKSYNSEM